jgi:hypothetical protein
MTALFKGYLRYRGVPFITGHEAPDESEDPLDAIFVGFCLYILLTALMPFRTLIPQFRIPFLPIAL